MVGTKQQLQVVDANGKPLTLSVDQNLAVKAIVESRRQADAAAWGVELALAQLLLTLAATIFLVFNFRQTRSALEQGERALRQERDQNREQLRPYAHVSQAFLEAIEPGKKVRLSIVVRNSGQSPALRVQIRGNSRLGTNQEQVEPLLPPGHWAHWVLGSNGGEVTIPISSDEEITEEQIERLRKRQLWVLLYGSIAYTDIFGEEHISTFAYRTRDRVVEGRAELLARPKHNFIDAAADLQRWREELTRRDVSESA